MKVSFYNLLRHVLESDRYPDIGFSEILYATGKVLVTSGKKATHCVANACCEGCRLVQYERDAAERNRRGFLGSSGPPGLSVQDLHKLPAREAFAASRLRVKH